MMLDEMTFIQGPAIFPNLDRFLLQVVEVKSEAGEKRLVSTVDPWAMRG